MAKVTQWTMLKASAASPMRRTSVTDRGMSTTVRYKLVFSSHKMKKLAVPSRLGMLETVFALNSKCQRGVARHAPQHVPAWEQLRRISSS